MQACGEAALEKEDGYATDIRMEWQLKRTDKKFNLRTATMELLRKMVHVDPSLYIKSKITNEELKADKDIPINAEFNRVFAMKEDNLFKGPPQIIAFIT
eukprot:2712944-Ditylum_brightwellii.AAC.1